MRVHTKVTDNDSVTYELAIGNVRHVLVLEPNLHLTTVTKNCFYRGTVANVTGSSVALSTCDGLVNLTTKTLIYSYYFLKLTWASNNFKQQGFISIDGITYIVEPTTSFISRSDGKQKRRVLDQDTAISRPHLVYTMSRKPAISSHNSRNRITKEHTSKLGGCFKVTCRLISKFSST